MVDRHGPLPRVGRRVRGDRSRLAPTAVGVAAGAMVVGYIATEWASARLDARMLPWVVGRGLGVAGYLALTALTAVGLWLRHPWRLRWQRPSPLTQMWAHASLAAVTALLVAGHIVALCLDRFAGVGWHGAFVPGQSTYRPLAVGLGTVGLYLGVLVGFSVPLAGRVLGRSWLPLHRLASGAFAVVWLHGLLAGSDTARLRMMYAATGAVVCVLALSRRLARQPLATVPAAGRP